MPTSAIHVPRPVLERGYLARQPPPPPCPRSVIRAPLSVVRASCHIGSMASKAAASARVRFYGKLRSDPEYLGQLSDEEPDVSFGDWIDRSIGFAHHEGRRRWRSAYDAGATHAFLFRPKRSAPRILAGTLTPSQDSVGRAFPLFALTTITLEAPDAFACAPVAGGAFFLDSESTLRDARASAVAAHVTDALPRLPAIDAQALSEASREFGEWSAAPMLVSKVWKDLFPRGRAARALDLLGALVEARDVLEGGSKERLYVRLPLGAGGAASASLWFHILSRVIDASRIMAAAWPISSGGPLVIALGEEPPIDFLLRLWLADPRGSPTLDATQAEASSRGVSRLPAAVTSAATSREASVHDLLYALSAK